MFLTQGSESTLSSADIIKVRTFKKYGNFCDAEYFWLIDHSQHFISAAIFHESAAADAFVLFIVLQRGVTDEKWSNDEAQQGWKTASSYISGLMCHVFTGFRSRWKWIHTKGVPGTLVGDAAIS